MGKYTKIHSEKEDNSGEDVAWGIYAIIFIIAAFFFVPNNGWVIGLLMALFWPLVLIFVIINSL